MPAGAQRRGGKAIGSDPRRFQRGRADMPGQIVELAFGIDDDRLHIVERLLDDPAHGPALAGTRAALEQQASGQQPVEVELERAGRVAADRNTGGIAGIDRRIGHRGVWRVSSIVASFRAGQRGSRA
jgi:hypothetical protein